jgi:hypothetical protein
MLKKVNFEEEERHEIGIKNEPAVLEWHCEIHLLPHIASLGMRKLLPLSKQQTGTNASLLLLGIVTVKN